MTTQQTAIAQRSKDKLFFDHRDMDYYLSWVIGRQIYHGSAADECLETAARIMNGDAASWQRAWAELAQRVEDHAQNCLTNHPLGEARSAFLRACTYHRAPLFMMARRDVAFQDTWQKMQACFRAAASRFDPPIESIAVPYGAQRLSGYFWKGDTSTEPRPTLLVIGGIETFAEDCYFMTGHTGTQRGYNLMTVDLPGQGTNPDRGLFFGARMEVPVKAVIDYALSRPDVDAERLALFGFSWGGHIAFKAAQHDRRIKAMIANPAMPNVFRAVLAQQKGHNRRDPIARIVFDQIVWRMGLKISLNPRDIGRRMAKAYDYLVYGTADPRAIDCPTLCLAGEGEAPITLQIARECFGQLPHPAKKLVIFTQAEGGEAHCQVNNLALPNRVMFDWLDTVFA
ncbi:MAG: alpha/beta hydrolase [Chloroflexota bacterium]|nr:alpha/beta hydrolase [Chloroflexota bacterium]